MPLPHCATPQRIGATLSLPHASARPRPGRTPHLPEPMPHAARRKRVPQPQPTGDAPPKTGSEGAGERPQAEHDRTTSHEDRSFAAGERVRAGADRGAAAREREDASLDALTGALVRGPGLRQLEGEIARSRRTQQPLTVAFVDVDHLKAGNDAGGHAAGDRLLSRVTEALRQRLRPYDLVIRYGGDEFVCALADVEAPEAESRFASVNADLTRHGSITAGVVTALPDEDLAPLLQRADAALYMRRRAQPRT
jgi:diguanylate cyclase (GGDEF)-like protein